MAYLTHDNGVFSIQYVFVNLLYHKLHYQLYEVSQTDIVSVAILNTAVCVCYAHYQISSFEVRQRKVCVHIFNTTKCDNFGVG